MQVKVLKEFPYAHNGTTVKLLKKGETAQVRDELVEGLKADGFVGDVGKADKATPAPEPDKEPAEEKEPAPESEPAEPKADAKAKA